MRRCVLCTCLLIAFCAANNLPTCFNYCADNTTGIYPLGADNACVKQPLKWDSYPIWIYSGNWNSLDVVSLMTQILVEDVLGFTDITFAYGAWDHGREPHASMGGPDVPGTMDDGVTPLVCDESKHTCGTTAPLVNGCSAGSWPCFRPQCVNNSACKDIIFNNQNWAKSQMEQIVTNLNLSLNVIWAGGATKDIMIEQDNSKTPTLFYDFIPTLTVSVLPITRVTLPAHDGNQYLGTQPNRYNAQGPIASDFPSQALEKWTSGRLKTNRPLVEALIQKIKVLPLHMDGLLQQFPGVTASCDNACIKAAACRWLRNNTDVWKSWIPTPTCDVGSVYEAADHRCKPCSEETDANGTYAFIAPPGATECRPCPLNFVPDYSDADNIVCVQSVKKVKKALNTSSIVVLFAAIISVWLAMTVPLAKFLRDIVSEFANSLISGVIAEAANDAAELAAFALIISGLDEDISGIYLAQLLLMAFAVINIIIHDCYSIYLVKCNTPPRLRLMETYRQAYSSCSLFIITPALVMEGIIAWRDDEVTDFICLIILACDFGYRLHSFSCGIHAVRRLYETKWDIPEPEIEPQDKHGDAPSKVTVNPDGLEAGPDIEMEQMKMQGRTCIGC